MAINPNFAATPRGTAAPISTANTARDGTGTIATVFTAGTSGSRVDRVRIQASGTTTAGVVRLFLNDGSNTRLLSEHLVTAATPSTTVEAWSVDLDLVALGRVIQLPNGWSLRASTHNAEGFNVFAFGGDY